MLPRKPEFGCHAHEDAGTAPVRESIPLTRLAEVFLILAIIIPPFLFGARQAYGQTVLAICTLSAASLCLLRWCLSGARVLSWKRPEVWLPCAAMALVALTCVPLPAAVVRSLAPGIDRVLPHWSDGSMPDLGNGWSYLSMAPGLSREACTLFMLYVILFWTTLSVVRSPDSVRRLLRAMFWCGFVVATVGLVHYLFWNGKFYAVWDLWWVTPERQVRAPFTNRNHFAGFLALTVSPGLAWLLCGGGKNAKERPPRTRRGIVLAGIGLAVILGGIFLSGSRGGIIVTVVVLAMSLFALRRVVRPAQLGAAAGAAFAVALVVYLIAGGGSFGRLRELVAGEQSAYELTNGRLAVWKADLHTLIDFPLFGSGAGTHSYVSPLYLGGSQRVAFTHAESGYVQVLTECGLAGGVLLGLAILFVGRQSLRLTPLCHGLPTVARSGDRATTGRIRGARHSDQFGCVHRTVVAISLFAVLLHGAVDFVWYVPAYAATVAVLAGLVFAINRMAGDPKSEIRSSKSETNLRFKIQTSKGPNPAVSNFEIRHLDLFRISYFVLRVLGFQLAWAIIVGFIVSHYFSLCRAEYAWANYFTLLPAEEGKATLDDNAIAQRLAWLEEACRSRPAEPEYWYRLGLLRRQRFLAAARGKEMDTLIDVRVTLEATSGTDKPQTWLRRRFGATVADLADARAAFRHCLHACPLFGAAYVRLAQLGFIDELPKPSAAAFLEQAELVRPHDPRVCLQAGTESWLRGDLAAAGRCWHRACRLEPEYQLKVLAVLSPWLPADEIVRLVQPDFAGLEILARQELKKGNLEAHRSLTAQARESLENDADRSRNADAWVSLHELYRQANPPQEMEYCLRKAIALEPAQCRYQLLLLQWLIDRKAWDDALRQLLWTEKVFPANSEVAALRKTLSQRRNPRN